MVIDDIDVYNKRKFPLAARKKVGLVFQYPENQLFANTIIKDVTFGPINNGLTIGEANKIAADYLNRLGITSEKFSDNPLELSGGQQRLVALAGVLAMQPKLLVLDEPTSGLDNSAKNRLFQILDEEISDRNCAVILISHNLADVANHCQKTWIFADHHLLKKGSTQEVLSDSKLLQKAGLDLSAVMKIYQELFINNFVSSDVPLNLDELTSQIVNNFEEGSNAA